jgi:branched-chain amino acid transport system substrate-binding protein
MAGAIVFSIGTLLASGLLASAFLGGCNGGAKNGDGGTTPSASNSGSGGGRPMPTADGNAATGNTVKIGMVASLNGDLKPWGSDSEKGARLAVEEFNAAGGLNGKKVELLVEDSQSTPEKGKTAAEKLMSDGVIAIVGEIASGITAQIAQAAFEKGVPVVTPGATRVDITQIGANVFRVCYIDDFQGPVMAKFAYEERGKRKIALLTDKRQPYSTGLSDSFRRYFTELGGEIVDEQFYESGQTQFTGQLTNIKAKNPDGLFLSGYFNEVGPIARQAKEVGLSVELFGGDGWDSSEILTSGGEAILGGFFCNHYNNKEDRPEVKAFLDLWNKKYGGVPATAMGPLAYDAMALTLDALKRASEPNSRALMDAIANTEDFKGASGSITLKDQNGNPPKRALVVRLTKEGPVAVKAYEYFLK